ncbi:hypothetical protein, partial [Nonomuraea rubra]
IWKDTMLAALKGTPATEFTPINSSRFGGCGSGCQPVDRSDEPRGDDDSDGQLEDVDVADFD